MRCTRSWSFSRHSPGVIGLRADLPRWHGSVKGVWGVRAYRGAEKSATRGCVERLGLQRWSDALGGFDHASLASELAANLRWLLSCRLSLATSTPPHIALFSAPLQKATGQTRRPNGRRQREPEGRSPARMRRQGGAKRPPRQGGLRVGVGGAVQSNLTTQPTQQPAPPTPAAAQAERRRPPPQHPRQREPFSGGTFCMIATARFGLSLQGLSGSLAGHVAL